jgi:hypothetical protein
MELFIGQASLVDFKSTPTRTALSFLTEVENVIDIYKMYRDLKN